MYYACNIYYDCNTEEKTYRDMLSLEEEQTINETSNIRIIGLTIETRPDYISVDKNGRRPIELDTVAFFGRLGVTRVQIGVQHTDDHILKKVNRKCTDLENMRGIRLFKTEWI